MGIEVTVFMPVYNCEKYLEEAIKSILNQNFKNFELLIINDGSTDKSYDILKRFNDNRIRIYNNERNMGLPYTRNKGLKLARGRYLALMDADDISKPNRLEKQVEFLNNNIDVDIVASNVDWLIDNKLKKSKKYFFNYDNANIGLMFRNVIINSSSMIRMDLIKRYNIIYKEEYFVGQDYAFWVDCQDKANLRILGESLLIYRYGHDNITKKSRENNYLKRKNILDKTRIRSLKKNGFNLDIKEYETFNKVFSDPVMKNSFEDFKACKNILNKMLKINEEMSKFDKVEFSNVMKYELTNTLLSSKLSKVDKINVIKYRFKYESVISYLIAYIRVVLQK